MANGAVAPPPHHDETALGVLAVGGVVALGGGLLYLRSRSKALPPAPTPHPTPSPTPSPGPTPTPTAQYGLLGDVCWTGPCNDGTPNGSGSCPGRYHVYRVGPSPWQIGDFLNQIYGPAAVQSGAALKVFLWYNPLAGHSLSDLMGVGDLLTIPTTSTAPRLNMPGRGIQLASPC